MKDLLGPCSTLAFWWHQLEHCAATERRRIAATRDTVAAGKCRAVDRPFAIENQASVRICPVARQGVEIGAAKAVQYLFRPHTALRLRPSQLEHRAAESIERVAISKAAPKQR